MHRRKPVLPAPRIKGMHSSRGKSRSHPARVQADPRGVSGRFRRSQENGGFITIRSYCLPDTSMKSEPTRL
ncbi:hypothetical protein APA78_33510 [Pseudomonas aeruginosa]|nr:hypothetical protein APA78_33510 [Pseudomonas aeruginosa]